MKPGLVKPGLVKPGLVKPGLVKPETALFLEKSHELLERADTMMGVGLTNDAGGLPILPNSPTATT